MGRTADESVILKKVIDDLHRVIKQPKVITKEAGCFVVSKNTPGESEEWCYKKMYKQQG